MIDLQDINKQEVVDIIRYVDFSEIFVIVRVHKQTN